MAVKAHEFWAVVARHYKDKPDDYALSLGHWEATDDHPTLLLDFHAVVRVTMGEVRSMAEPD